MLGDCAFVLVGLGRGGLGLEFGLLRSFLKLRVRLKRRLRLGRGRVDQFQ